MIGNAITPQVRFSYKNMLRNDTETKLNETAQHIHPYARRVPIL